MGELSPIEPDKLSDRELSMAVLSRVDQSHTCLENHIGDFSKYVAERRLADLTATEKRQELADDVLSVKGDMIDVRATVREMALALGVRKPEGGEVRPKATTGMSWKATGMLVVSLLGAIGGLIFVYQAVAVVFPTFHHWMMSLSPT